MGIQDWLPNVLPSAGTEVDLRKFRDGIDVMVQKPSRLSSPIKRQRVRRPLRIGVDISNWISRACHRYSPMLGDKNHLTNYGRYTLHNNTTQQHQPEGNGTANDNREKEKETSKKYITECTLYVLERLQSLQQETNAEILVVLDGATPPIKRPTVLQRSEVRKVHERVRDAPVVEMATMVIDNDTNQEDTMEANLKERTKANRRAGAGKHFRSIVEELIYALRVNKIPFMVAPYEADGQLAWLSKERFIDMCITEDSDMVAQGGICILYKLDFSIIQSTNNSNRPEDGRGNDTNNKQGQQNGTTTYGGRSGSFSFVPRGTLLLRDNLGAVTITKRNANDDQKPLSLKDMSDAMLAVMFVAAGCDYCESLKGIGLVKACAIVQKAFLQQTETVPLKLVFRQLFQQTYDKTIQDDVARQKIYKQNFIAALVMYRHPVVYNPFLQRCMVVNKEKGDPELIKYSSYEKLLKDDEGLKEILGELIEDPMATFIAEGWVNAKTKELYECSKTAETLPKAVKEHFGLIEDPSSDKAMSGMNGNDKDNSEHKEDDVRTNSNIFDDAEGDDVVNEIAVGVATRLLDSSTNNRAPPVDDEDTTMQDDTQTNTGSTAGPATQEHSFFGSGATVMDNTQTNTGSSTGPDTQKPGQNQTDATATNNGKDCQNQDQTRATIRTETTTTNSTIFDDAEGDDGFVVAVRIEKPVCSRDQMPPEEEDGDTAMPDDTQDTTGNMTGTQADTQGMLLETQEPLTAMNSSEDSPNQENTQQGAIDESMQLETQEPIAFTAPS